VWRWCNFLHRQTEADKIPLRVNMDETSVRLYPLMRAGSLAYRARLEQRGPRSLTTNVTRGQMRGTLSLVCFVCDDVRVQTALPQILLVRKQFCPRCMLANLLEAVQPPVTVWVVENSWMTADLMIKVLNHLKMCLKEWAATHQIILSADAFRAHISPRVWRKAAALDIMFFVIPAKMTWALQPCDTHVFAKLKHYIANAVQAELVRSTNNKLTVLMIVVAVNHALHQVVTTGNWRMAFWDLGLTGVQACISETCLRKLEMLSRPQVPTSLPTLIDLMTVLPGRSSLPIDDMFRIFLKRARCHPSQVVAAHQENMPLASSVAQPWLGRLRSSSALNSQNIAEAEPPAPCHAPMPTTMPPPSLSPVTQTMNWPRARRWLPWRPRPRPPHSDTA
jgi:hypothetical protein